MKPEVTLHDYTIVFDLDDTLYLERDFVRSGYCAANAWLKRHHGRDGLAEICWDLFNDGQRLEIFDAALQRLDVEPNSDLITKLVYVYRSHIPSISLQPDAARFLTRYQDQPRALITDGPVDTQMAKVRALGIEDQFQHLVCSDQWGVEFRKPHVKPYLSVETWSHGSGKALVYVADNAAKDFLTPKARGWRTVQILRDGRVHTGSGLNVSYQADAMIKTLDELDACLMTMPTNPRCGVPS